MHLIQISLLFCFVVIILPTIECADHIISSSLSPVNRRSQKTLVSVWAVGDKPHPIRIEEAFLQSGSSRVDLGAFAVGLLRAPFPSPHCRASACAYLVSGWTVSNDGHFHPRFKVVISLS